MGRKLTYLALILLGAFGSIRIINFFSYSDIERIELKIVKRGELNIYHLFNLLSPPDKKSFIVDTIISNHQMDLIYLGYDQCYSISKYYYLDVKRTSKGFLKAPGEYRLLEDLTIPQEDCLKHIIKLDLFNMYSQITQINSIDKIIEAYVSFFDDREGTLKHKQINAVNDLSELIKERPPYSNFFDNLLDIDSLEIDFSKGYYYWFFDEGVVRIDFNFRGFQLDSAIFTKIGYLGNENLGI